MHGGKMKIRLRKLIYIVLVMIVASCTIDGPMDEVTLEIIQLLSL